MALALGYGRSAAGVVGGDLVDGVETVGFNAYRLRTTSAMDVVNGLKVEPTGRTYKLALTQDHHAMDAIGSHEREHRLGEIIKEGTAAEFAKEPEAIARGHEHGLPELPLFDAPTISENHKWGMAVDLSLYAVLLWMLASVGFGGTPEPASSFSQSMFLAGCLSIWAAMTWNFLLNRRLTFNDTRGGSIVRQYLTYALGNALGIVVSLTLRLYLPSRFEFFALHRLAAAVVGIVVATGISFSMSRWIVFRRKPASTSPPTSSKPADQPSALV